MTPQETTQERLNKASRLRNPHADAMASAIADLKTDLYDSEFDVNYIRAGVLSDLFTALNRYEQLERQYQSEEDGINGKALS